MDTILLGVLWYVVLVLSLTFHEAAHAWAALRGGDQTAYLGGQVSLDPIPHMRREPFGTVVAPWFFFVISGLMVGWASTPYDPRWAFEHPRRAGWMSLAGPGANALLVLVAAGAVRVGMAVGVFAPPDAIAFSQLVVATGPGIWETVATLVSLLFTLNLLLCIFNLLPVPPLDGSGALGVVLSTEASRRVQELMHRPTLALGGLLLAWIAIGQIFRPVHLFAVNLLFPGLEYH